MSATWAEIAAELGCTEREAEQIAESALAKLRCNEDVLAMRAELGRAAMPDDSRVTYNREDVTVSYDGFALKPLAPQFAPSSELMAAIDAAVETASKRAQIVDEWCIPVLKRAKEIDDGQ